MLGGDVRQDLSTLHRTPDIYTIPLTSRGSIAGTALVFVRRVLRKLLEPLFMRQVTYNQANTRVVQTLVSEVERLEAEVVEQALSIPAWEGGRISIVIPVFNNFAFTYRCLASLAQHCPPGAYEIIVVDNASTDDTARLLGHAQGLRVVRNDTNRGFGDACSQGAQLARGDFLLFLNNDTIALDDFLSPLVDTLTRDPSIGAAGAQLLYPDGRLQEAGAILWNDAHGWNYGRGDTPDRPQYRYLRDVDYCSGACLLVRRALFDRVGGFDPRFAPAYYEDVDLCFQLRRIGFRVVYQPRARVVHFEGATAGTDLTAGNRTLFVEKHALALARQFPPDARHVFRARDHRPGKRILLVDHHVPLPDRDAGSARVFALLRLLSELGHKVTFAADGMAPDFAPAPADRLQQLGVEVLLPPLALPSYIEEHLEDFDLLILCRVTVAAKYLPAIASRENRPPAIFDTIDLHFLRESRQAEVEGNAALAREAEITKSFELHVARLSHRVWVVNPYEAELLRRENPALPVEVVPLIQEVRDTVPKFLDRRDLMFLGGFRHGPNEDAVAFFVTEIFPRLRRELPGVRLLVAGGDLTPAVRALAADDVAILGFVKDINPVFDACRVFVAPLRYGAGLRGKILYSLGSGLPVVTTTVGAEGIGLADREEALIADDAAEFAARVVELYRDEALWTHLSERGRRHVEAHFSYESVKAKVADTVSAVAR
jgi:GT2 family glycosyltransferase/glycosyltransferase involved in cell wall biosynthesis